MAGSQNQERDESILRYWAAGMSYRKLARKFNLAKNRIQVIVTRENKALGQRHLTELDDIRGEELRKLAFAEQQIMYQVRSGGTKAIKLLLDIQKRRAALLGLDAPKQVQVSGPGGAPLLSEQQQALLTDPATIAEAEKLEELLQQRASLNGQAH